MADYQPGDHLKKGTQIFILLSVVQLCDVIHSSLNKAVFCRSGAKAVKEIKFQEDAISEILVADTDLESDAEASNVDYFEEEEEKITTEAAAAGLSQVEPQAATIG